MKLTTYRAKVRVKLKTDGPRGWHWDKATVDAASEDEARRLIAILYSPAYNVGEIVFI